MHTTKRKDLLATPSNLEMLLSSQCLEQGHEEKGANVFVAQEALINLGRTTHGSRRSGCQGS